MELKVTIEYLKEKNSKLDQDIDNLHGKRYDASKRIDDLILDYKYL